MIPNICLVNRRRLFIWCAAHQMKSLLLFRSWHLAQKKHMKSEISHMEQMNMIAHHRVAQRFLLRYDIQVGVA